MPCTGLVEIERRRLAQEARRSVNEVTDFSRTFRDAMAEVRDAIGGSAQKSDRRIMEILRSADEELARATGALQVVSRP